MKNKKIIPYKNIILIRQFFRNSKKRISEPRPHLFFNNTSKIFKTYNKLVLKIRLNYIHLNN